MEKSLFQMNLKAIREARNLTQNEMAQLLGVEYFSYRKYEGGGVEPRYNSLVSISNTLKISTDKLLKEDIGKTMNHNEILLLMLGGK